MFCEFCGKEIPEGEVCGCEAAAAQRMKDAAAQNPAPAANPEKTADPAPAPEGTPAANDFGQKLLAAFKGIPSAFLSLLKDPEGTGIGVARGAIFACAGWLFHILAWLCVTGSIAGSFPYPLKGIYGTAVWCGCLSYWLPYLMRMAILLLGQLIRKEKVNVLSGLVTASSLEVFPAILFLLAGLFCFFSFELGLFIIMVAAMLGTIGNYRLIAKNMKNEKTLGATALAALILAVVIMVVVFVENRAIAGYFVDLAQSAMGGWSW